MLFKSCETLPGVGPSLAKKLANCGIQTLIDLLLHLPYRYQDRTEQSFIQDLRVNEYSVVVGKITNIELVYGKRKMLYCYVNDNTGILRLRFFHFHKQQIKNLKEGQEIQVFGEVKLFSNQLEMIHPEYKLKAEKTLLEENLTPLYPLSQGLTQNRMRQLINLALNLTEAELMQLEWMNPAQLQMYNFPPFAEALNLLHNPPPMASQTLLEQAKHPAIKRIIFDELLAKRLAMNFAKENLQSLRAPFLAKETKLSLKFRALLPFELTKAQLKVNAEIADNLASIEPMLRLVQGDVGCGKTTVAALAAIQAIAAKVQVALMAPTDLLSEQHAFTLEKWFTPLGLKVCRLSGKMKQAEKRAILAKIANSEAELIVGTHALFQEGVKFANLGLVIIDEQHRFGVLQRLELQLKGQNERQIPHQLLMTATPIPRTLAMTVYAHLNISIIDELPIGRLPIKTAIINQAKRDTIIERLKLAIQAGTQVYWICTLIEESEKLQCQAATLTAQSLQIQVPGAKIGLVHGKLTAVEKEAILRAFKDKLLDLLVATTVIEVGVDVPNATLMIIENAERLGLSQLHQLRGRVGRGSQQSFCLLLYQSPLSKTSAERLRIMRESNDGFLIAEKDLQLRGSGQILGTRQTGYNHFKIANLKRDEYLLPLVSELSQSLKSQPELAKSISQRWLGEVEQFLQC